VKVKVLTSSILFRHRTTGKLSVRATATAAVQPECTRNPTAALCIVTAD
jgi:hypothetical protein